MADDTPRPIASSATVEPTSVDELVKKLSESMDSWRKEADQRRKSISEEHYKNPAKTYSYFAKFDAWKVIDEAIPLVLGWHPSSLSSGWLSDKGHEIKLLVERAGDQSLQVSCKDQRASKWMVSPPGFLSWCASIGIQPPQGLIAAVSARFGDSKLDGLPYETPELRIMLDVMRKHWLPYIENPESNSRPKNDYLAAVVEETALRYMARPISNNMRDHILALMRPEDERKGGLTKRKG